MRGDDDPDTLNAMSGIAQLYYYQEKLDAAEEALNQLLKRRLRVRGPDHPETLEATNNLAMVYFGQYQAVQLAKRWPRPKRSSPRPSGCWSRSSIALRGSIEPNTPPPWRPRPTWQWCTTLAARRPPRSGC